MTKKEIVKAISEELGLTQLKTKEIVQKTFDAIIETLVTDRRIELRNFGVFEVKEEKVRLLEEAAHARKLQESDQTPSSEVVEVQPSAVTPRAPTNEPAAGFTQSNP